jgi:hypothetical protein
MRATDTQAEHQVHSLDMTGAWTSLPFMVRAPADLDLDLERQYGWQNGYCWGTAAAVWARMFQEK